VTVTIAYVTNEYTLW